MKKAKKAKAAGADWREAAADRVRRLILAAEPRMVVEQKWRKPSNGMKGVPVFSLDGLVCTLETYKEHVKVTFARGAALADPKGLFNAPFTGATRRAIDLRAGDALDETAFKSLVKAAVKANPAR